jgi:hypothetical protein
MSYEEIMEGTKVYYTVAILKGIGEAPKLGEKSIAASFCADPDILDADDHEDILADSVREVAIAVITQAENMGWFNAENLTKEYKAKKE